MPAGHDDARDDHVLPHACIPGHTVGSHFRHDDATRYVQLAPLWGRNGFDSDSKMARGGRSGSAPWCGLIRNVGRRCRFGEHITAISDCHACRVSLAFTNVPQTYGATHRTIHNVVLKLIAAPDLLPVDFGDDIALLQAR